jgi:Gluconolactonase
MKTITKFIYAAFAVVIVAMGTVTANGAVGDLFASIGGRPNPSASPQGSINEYSSIGIESTFASPLTNPRGMAFDSAGNLFVATTSNDTPVQATILKFTPDGTVTPFGTLASNLFATGVAIDHSDNVFVACEDNDNGVDAHIIKFTPDGTQTTFASLPGQTFGSLLTAPAISFGVWCISTTC